MQMYIPIMLALASSKLPGNPTELRVDLAVRVASCDMASDLDNRLFRLTLVDWNRSLIWRGSR